MIRNPSSTTLVQPPGSVPGMTNSRSSKSSSFHSVQSDDGGVISDVAHFEDIGLEDDTTLTATNTPKANHAMPNSRRITTRGPIPQSTNSGRTLAANPKRAPTPRRSFPNLRNSLYTANPRSTSTAGLTDPRQITLKKNYSTTSVPHFHRNRSISPGLTIQSHDPYAAARPRRGSWQSSQRRKSVTELEQECDEDQGDDIPDGLFLDNVPISPRPPSERAPSRAQSVSTSPERAPKERVRSVGNGTPAIAQAQGSLRSPTWRSDSASTEGRGPGLKSRSHSWNNAHADLSAEARVLTEKLEEHADEEAERQVRRPSVARPYTWNSSQTTSEYSYDKKERVKSSTPALPPLRRTDGIIDPLPVSKEKEAVLSRTRPSWLPPKDPAEEKRHLKEYGKMMAASIKADERREAARLTRTTKRDSDADQLMQVWETEIIPNWNDAIRERRTRNLWWKGIAPRSRAKVWSKAIGNELGLTAESFTAALQRAHELEERVQEDRGSPEDVRNAKWFEQIRKDVSDNTWNELRIFQAGGPLHESLVDVLGAYSMYRVDIGYVPGCNTIAALLLLNLPDAETAFICLANMLNRPLPLSFYASDSTAKASAYNLVLQTLGHKSSTLHEHLTKGIPGLDTSLYLNDIFTSLFTSLLAIDEAARLWDVYIFEGDALLIRAAVAVLLDREMDLLGSSSSEHVWKIMAKASRDTTAPRAVGEEGAEDRFMQTVRDAGKA